MCDGLSRWDSGISTQMLLVTKDYRMLVVTIPMLIICINVQANHAAQNFWEMRTLLYTNEDNAQGSSRMTEVAKFPPAWCLRTWKDLVLHICTLFARSLSRTSEPFLCHSLTVSLESLKASVKGSSFTTRHVCRWEGKLSQVIVNYTTVCHSSVDRDSASFMIMSRVKINKFLEGPFLPSWHNHNPPWQAILAWLPFPIQ